MLFFHFFFWFLVSVAAINLAWIGLEYFTIRLNLSRRFTGKVEEDDTLEIETLIKNNSFFPAFNLVLEDDLSCSPGEKELLLVDYLGAGSALELKYSCLCPLRGNYKIGPFTVYFFDPFGIFFLKKTYYIYTQLYVYPRTFEIKKFPVLTRGFLPWFGIQTTQVSGDEDEFFGIREYKEGDPIKKIHWISTARKRALIVKQFQRQSFFRATIIFNLEKEKNFGAGKERVAEYTIRIAASLAKYLIEKGISTEIIAHAGEIVYIPFNKGPEYLEDIFKFLATAQAESRVSLGEIFEEFSLYIPGDSNLIVIIPDTDWEYLSAMLSLKKRNINIMPMVLVTSTFLNPFDKEKIKKDIRIKISPDANLNPIFFAQGDNLEEFFQKY